MFEVKLLSKTAKLPLKQEGSIGYDLFCDEEFYIDPFQRKLVKLGFSASFPSGYVGLLLDKSGMGKKGITRFGGVIDPNYRDEWKCILFNSAASVFRAELGKAIVQVVFLPVGLFDVVPVEKLSETARGLGGFGSTELKQELSLRGFYADWNKVNSEQVCHFLQHYPNCEIPDGILKL